jgi:hypothetical protein
MSFDIQQLKQMVTESGLSASSRTLRIALNDYTDAHPSLRADIIEIIKNRDNYRRPYDQQRDMEETIRAYDRKNGNVLENMGIEPSRLIEYVRDRINRHLEHAAQDLGLSEAPRISRGRMSTRSLLTGPAPAADGDDIEES